VIGTSIEAIEQQGNGAFFIVQINRRGGEAITRPEGSVVVAESDGLVLVGRGAQARALSSLFEARGRTRFRVSALRLIILDQRWERWGWRQQRAFS
jgi:hypothetical protein